MTDVGIYIIKSPTGKIYVGQSWHLKYRRRGYQLLKCTQQRKLYFSLLKHGFDKHEFSVAHYLPADVDQKVLDQYEWLYWEQYKNCGCEMLNLTTPGLNKRLSDETKKRMSEIRKGVKKTEEWKASVRKPKPEYFGEMVRQRLLGQPSNNKGRESQLAKI